MMERKKEYYQAIFDYFWYTVDKQVERYVKVYTKAVEGRCSQSNIWEN